MATAISKWYDSVYPSTWPTMSGSLAVVYKPVYDYFEGNEMILSCAVHYFLLMFTFWSACGLFMLVDLYGWAPWLKKYKVQPAKNEPVNRTMLIEATKYSAFNNIVMNGLCVFPIYWGQKYMGCSYRVEDLPSLAIFIRDFYINNLVVEIVFYYVHLLFHWSPYLYKRIHKVHHEWTAPISVIALHTHPIEYAIIHMLALHLGMILASSHVMYFWMYMSAENVLVVIRHCGYHFPLFPSPELHDFHHVVPSNCLSPFGWLDWVHGTDKQYRKSMASKRHRVLFSLTPISTLLPDTKKVDTELPTDQNRPLSG